MSERYPGFSNMKHWALLIFLGLMVFIPMVLSSCSGGSGLAQVADLRSSKYAFFQLNNAGQVALVQMNDEQSQIYIDRTLMGSVDMSKGHVNTVQINDLGHAVWITVDESGNKLFFYRNGETIQISDGISNPYEPRINNNDQIVFVALQDNEYHVFSYENGVISRLTETSGSYFKIQLSDNGHVAWFKAEEEVAHMYIYGDGAIKQVNDSDIFTEGGERYTARRINNGGQVVWSSDENDDVYDSIVNFYDGDALIKLKPIVNNRNPVINAKGQVVWQGWDGNDHEIFLYDNAEIIKISDNEAADDMPVINDHGVVAWAGNDGNDSEIFTYSDGVITQLTDNETDDFLPQINNNGQVAWLARNADGDMLGLYRAEAGYGRIINLNAGEVIDPSSTPWMSMQAASGSEAVAPAPSRSDGEALPLAAEAPLYSFAVLGDSRLDGGWAPGTHKFPHKFVAGLSEHIASRKPAFVVFVGDMATIPGEGHLYPPIHLDGWLKMFGGPLANAGIPLYPAMGNHETYDFTPLDYHGGMKGWFDPIYALYSIELLYSHLDKQKKFLLSYKENDYYYWDIGNTRFIVLNYYVKSSKWDSNGMPSDKLISAIETTLEQATENDMDIIVFGHTPLYNNNSKNADTLVKLLFDNNVRAYFAGHSHLYRHEVIGQARGDKIFHEYVVGASGAEIDPTSEWVKKQNNKPLHPNLDPETNHGSLFYSFARRYNYAWVDVFANKIEVTAFITENDLTKAAKAKDFPDMVAYEKFVVSKDGASIRTQLYCNGESQSKRTSSSRNDVLWCNSPSW